MVISRKKFLCGASASILSVPAFARALSAEAATGSDTILVFVWMGGGNDGFNTVIPLSPRGTAQYGNYLGYRPTIGVSEQAIEGAGTAFDANFATPAARATEYAFHPNMTALRGAYAKGNVAVLMGSGLPPDAPASRSHPNAGFAWAVGAVDQYLNTTLGWIGRTLDQFGTVPASIEPMVSTGGGMLQFGSLKNKPLSFNGAIDNFTRSYPNLPSASVLLATQSSVSATIGYGSSNSVSELARSVENVTRTALAKLAAMAVQIPASDYVITSTSDTGATVNTNTKIGLKQVARMLLAGNDSKVYAVRAGGRYDTHSNQLMGHPGGLREVSEGLVEFYDYMMAKSPALAKRLLIVTNSEFGRSVVENSTGGTDHGTSSVHFIMGSRVKGGVYGEYPSFKSSAIVNGYLAQTPYDYRNYLSDIIAAMGGDPVPILGKAYPKFGFI